MPDEGVKRSLPASVLRSQDPVTIIVDGVELLVREPTATEYSALSRQELEVINGKPVPKPSYSARLIELCVIDPAIPDADVLTPTFAYHLTAKLEELMGGTDDNLKNG